MKSVQGSTVVIVDVLLETEITFTYTRVCLFPKIKNVPNLRKTWGFFENKASCACVIMRKYFTPQISIEQFSTLTCLRNKTV